MPITLHNSVKLDEADARGRALQAARSVVKNSCACSWILSQDPCAAPPASALHHTGEKKAQILSPSHCEAGIIQLDIVKKHKKN